MTSEAYAGPMYRQEDQLASSLYASMVILSSAEECRERRARVELNEIGITRRRDDSSDSDRIIKGKHVIVLDSVPVKCGARSVRGQMLIATRKDPKTSSQKTGKRGKANGLSKETEQII